MKIAYQKLENAAGTKEIGEDYLIDGVAKAWVKRDFNNVTTDDSLNISSVTDVALGHNTLNLSSNMSNANYGFTGMASRTGNSTNNHIIQIDETVPTTSALALSSTDVAGNDKDPEHAGAMIVGDLA